MGKLILNGRNYSGLIDAQGVFIDTDNVITSGTHSGNFSYTATQDCFVYTSMAMAENTGCTMQIDGHNVVGGWNGAGSIIMQGLPLMLKKGQTLTISSTYTTNTDYIVYGVQMGSQVTFLSEYASACYSTTEREVGCWVDGKPLYQKSFVIDTSNLNTGWNDINSGLSGIDCKDITGKFRFPANDNSIYEFPYTEDSTYCLYGGYKPSNNTIFIYKGSGFATISDFVITLRYTKNTDTAGSGTWTPTATPTHHYSTNEQVIGTWIDGKPLYQITVDVANPVNDSNEHLVDLTSLSIDECPYLFGYAVRHSGANDITYYANSIEADDWYYFKARYDNFRDSIMYICLFRNDSISRMRFTIQYTKTTD